MKHTLSIIAVMAMAMLFSAGAFAKDSGYRHEKGSAGIYATIEPAAGDPAGVISLTDRQIRHLQKALKIHGYAPGRPDGKLGPKTESALKNFQKSKGLDETGTPTNETLIKLGFHGKEESPN